MNPVFDECPRFCHHYGKSKKETGFCAPCDLGIAKQEFEEAAKEELTRRFGQDWKKYDLQSIINDVISIYEVKHSNHEPTVTTKSLISIIDYEEFRQKRIHHWNMKQRAKAEEEKRRNG